MQSQQSVNWSDMKSTSEQWAAQSQLEDQGKGRQGSSSLTLKSKVMRDLMSRLGQAVEVEEEWDVAEGTNGGWVS